MIALSQAAAAAKEALEYMGVSLQPAAPEVAEENPFDTASDPEKQPVPVRAEQEESRFEPNGSLGTDWTVSWSMCRTARGNGCRQATWSCASRSWTACMWKAT